MKKIIIPIIPILILISVVSQAENCSSRYEPYLIFGDSAQALLDYLRVETPTESLAIGILSFNRAFDTRDTVLIREAYNYLQPLTRNSQSPRASLYLEINSILASLTVKQDSIKLNFRQKINYVYNGQLPDNCQPIRIYKSTLANQTNDPVQLFLRAATGIELIKNYKHALPYSKKDLDQLTQLVPATDSLQMFYLMLLSTKYHYWSEKIKKSRAELSTARSYLEQARRYARGTDQQKQISFWEARLGIKNVQKK